MALRALDPHLATKHQTYRHLGFSANWRFVGSQLACCEIYAHRDTTYDDPSSIVHIRGVDLGGHCNFAQTAATSEKE